MGFRVGCAFNYIFIVICIMLLDAIAMYVLLSSYKGRNKGIIIIGVVNGIVITVKLL